MIIMEDPKLTVLITTSGKGTRLGNLTSFTNKSLVRIGKKPALSYIIESYPRNTEFVITTGYYGSHVSQFLQIAHKDRDIKIVNVDRYEGDGSSLLASMFAAKHLLQKRFVFHCCDSIISQSESLELNENWCFSSKSKSAEHYRTHDVRDGDVVCIKEKGESYTELAHVGVIGVKNYKEFWKNAENLIKNFPNDQSLSDCHVVNNLIKSGFKFKSRSCEWLDIGNIKSLQDARKNINDKFEILDKDDESIFIFDEKFVVKFFHNVNSVTNRVERLKQLGKFGPKLIAHTENFYSYEYIKGIEASKIKSEQELTRLINDLFDNFWIYQNQDYNFQNSVRKFYIDKTIDRAELFYNKSSFRDQTVYVNGKKIDKLSDLIKRIPDEVLVTLYSYRFHGDLVLDNIIVGDKTKLIDWRQDFCGNISDGDIYYDLAKFNHSLVINHEIVSKGLFTYQENNKSKTKSVSVDILQKHLHSSFKNKFKEIVESKNLCYNKVELISALIWINMSPLHDIEFGKFLYYFGLYKLNEAIDKLQ